MGLYDPFVFEILFGRRYKTESAFSSSGCFHGEEIMNGKSDTLKRSYYANPLIGKPTVPVQDLEAHPEY